MSAANSRYYTTAGVVLRRNDLGESDCIVVILTPERGLLRAVARGARKPGSKLGGHLDLLRHVSVSARLGRTLDSVSQAETIRSFRGLHRDLGRLARGLYVAELAERTSVEDAPAPGVVRLLIQTLGWLERTTAPDLLVRWYELRLLHLTGFQPELQQCADCQRDLDPEPHAFSPARGGIVCPDCRSAGSDPLLPASVGAIKLLRYLRTAPWPQVEPMRVNDAERVQVERILRGHLQHVLERAFKSSAFLDEVRKWPASGPVPGGLTGRA